MRYTITKPGREAASVVIKGLNILDSNIVYADTATQDGAGIYMEQSDNVIINNIIRDNSAVAYGGAIATDASTSVCNNNFILNNTAASGGGISAFQDGLFSAANNVIANNNSISGGGIFFDGAGNFRFDNNTIAVNSASGSGGGMYATAAGNTIAFTNNIFWNNKKAGAANISGADFESSDINVFKNNLLQLPQAFYTAGNSNLLNVASVNNLFAVNPQFKDSSNLKGADNIYGTNDDGFVLKSFSPLINAGNNSAVTGIIIDAAHAARIVYGTVDIGAYEFGLINCSGINTWLGVVSSDWNNAANWTCNVPGINDEVIIRNGVPNMPVVNTDVTIKKLTALAGSTVTILTGKKLTLTGQ